MVHTSPGLCGCDSGKVAREREQTKKTSNHRTEPENRKGQGERVKKDKESEWQR